MRISNLNIGIREGLDELLNFLFFTKKNRDIFYVQEAFLVLPKFYCNVPGCHLLVINNDTFQEVKTVFRRVIPQVLTKNKVRSTSFPTVEVRKGYLPFR